MNICSALDIERGAISIQVETYDLYAKEFSFFLTKETVTKKNFIILYDFVLSKVM